MRYVTLIGVILAFAGFLWLLNVFDINKQEYALPLLLACAGSYMMGLGVGGSQNKIEEKSGS